MKINSFISKSTFIEPLSPNKYLFFWPIYFITRSNEKLHSPTKNFVCQDDTKARAQK